MLRYFAMIIQAALDTILPRKERVVRIESYSLEDVPISPVEHEACGTTITTLLNYRDQAVQDLVKALKYDRSGHAANLLSAALAEYLREEVANIRLFSTKPIVLIPVPLHASRLRERGFNQIERVLNALPTEYTDGTLARIDTASLTRSCPTLQQTRLTREERLTNVRGAFTATIDTLRGSHIILIDDVTTTGATLSEAAQPLAGETVTLLALAHA